MEQFRLFEKVGLGTLILSLLGGCAQDIPSATDQKEGQIINSSDAAKAPQAQTKQPTPGAAEQAPGMIIHIDPKTGELLSKPPGTPLPADKSTAGTQKELREVPSPVPGGGTMIELDDRFKNPLKATVGPDGKTTIQHQSETPASAEKMK